MKFLRQNTAVIIAVGPFYDKTDGVTIETGLTITNERITLTADTDDGSAPTNILDNVTGATSATSNDLNYITGNDAGMMQIELSAANTNRVGRMLLSITDAANHVPVFHELFVLPQAIYDWFTGVIVPLPANVTTIAGSAVSTTSAQLGVNVVNAAGTAWGSGAVTANSIATGAITNAKFAAGAIDAAAIANGAIDNATFAADVGSTAYATNIIALAADKAVVNAALATQASVNTIDDFLDTEVAAILAAVDTEVAAIKTKTDYLPSATAGAAGGLFIAGSNAATSITTALTANITGNLSGSVGSVTGAVGSVTGAVGSVTGAVGSVTGAVGSVAANGITATSIATDAINAAAVKADAVTKIQTGLATPTNITAGTITTVTNLTNAATSGDLTATMKTSVTTAATAATPTAAAVTGAVGSVTGNVGGNVVGSVGSVSGDTKQTADVATLITTVGVAGAGLTALATQASVNTIDDFLDTEIAAILADTNELQTDWANGGRLDLILDAASAPTAAAVADAVWDEALSGHTGSGTAGLALATASSGGVDPSVLADAIWDEALSGHATAGTTGKKLTDLANADLSGVATSTALATVAGYIDTEVAAILAAVDTEVAAIKTKTDYLPSATAGAAGGLFIAGSNAATSVTTALTANIAGNVSGSVGSVTGAVGSVTGAVGSVTGAVGSVTGNVGGNVVGSVASVANIAPTGTGLTAIPWNAAWDAEVQSEAQDAITASGLATATNLATLAGYVDTEVAAILAAVDTEVSAIKTKTDYLPSATAGAAGGVFIAGANAATSITTALTANITGNLSGSVGSVTGAVGSVTGAVGSVAGAVGSVTGNVGGNVVGSVASVTAGVTLANDAITAAKFDESTAFPLTSVDTGATRVARTGADADTLETLSDQLDAAVLDGVLFLGDTQIA